MFLGQVKYNETDLGNGNEDTQSIKNVDLQRNVKCFALRKLDRRPDDILQEFERKLYRVTD